MVSARRVVHHLSGVAVATATRTAGGETVKKSFKIFNDFYDWRIRLDDHLSKLEDRHIRLLEKELEMTAGWMRKEMEKRAKRKKAGK